MAGQIPALQALRRHKRLFTCAVPYSGGLADDDCARINNWFSKHLKDVPVEEWLLRAPVAHAATLLLASRMREEDTEEAEKDLLERAWSRQEEYSGKTIRGQQRLAPVDVDREAVAFLEERMFSQSKSAGIAGNC